MNEHNMLTDLNDVLNKLNQNLSDHIRVKDKYIDDLTNKGMAAGDALIDWQNTLRNILNSIDLITAEMRNILINK